MDYKEKVIALLNSQELTKEQKEKLEDIFPALKESEGERIRKALAAYFTKFKPNDMWDADFSFGDIVAWLEKQAEQKNTFSQPTEGEFPYNNPSNTLDGEIDNIWKKLSCGNEFSSNKNGFHEVIVHFANWIKNQSNKKWHYSNEKCMDNDAFVLFHSTFDNTWNLKNSSIINWNVVGKWALLSDILPAEEYNITGIGSKHAQGKLGEMIKKLKPADKVEPKFRVKYAGSEYNVLEVKDIAGVTYYGIEDEPNHIDYVQAENCERVGGYSIKENGSPYPTKPAKFSEQKPAWSEEDEHGFENCLYAIKETFKEIDNPHRVGTVNWLNSLKDRVQPKQEWSEEDEKMLDTVIEDIIRLAGPYVCYHKDVDFLKSLKDRVQPQPKREWSEEDKEMYKKVETAIDSYYAPFSRDAEEMSEWFKNLKDRIQPRPKQEWSEEDEKMRAAVLQLITDSEKENGWNCVYCNDKEIYFSDIIAWLKSIRPRSQWKPSDEQMENLSRAFNSGTFRTSLLMSLYQDLKKLREE